MCFCYAQDAVPKDDVSDYFSSAFAINLTSFIINESAINLDYTIKNNSITLTFGSPFEDKFNYSLFEQKDKYPFYSEMDEKFNRSAIQDFNVTTVFILGIQYRRYILPLPKAEIFPFLGISYDYKKPNFTIDTSNSSNNYLKLNRGFLASRRHNDISLNFGVVKLFNKIYLQASFDLTMSNRRFEYLEFVPNGSWFDFQEASQDINEVFGTINFKIGYCFNMLNIFKPKLSGYR
jgi:hypothetical protein